MNRLLQANYQGQKMAKPIIKLFMNVSPDFFTYLSPGPYVINIAKGTTGPRVEWSHQSNFFVISQFFTQIKLQNLDQASTSKSRPNFSIKISTGLQLQDLYQALCSKS